MILISVFDKKASRYHAPLAYDHISNAVRSYVSFARQKPEATQVQFAEDYDLYDVAEFDEVSGAIRPVIPPSFVDSMINIVAEARKVVRDV